MIYSRYLDIHLCTNTNLHKYDAGQLFGGENKHFYEFSASLMQQMRYRDAKNEGFRFNNTNTGNSRVLSDVELTHSDASFLTNPPHSFLDTATREVTYALNEELKQIRYVGCMVAIEHLKTTRVYSQLHQLMVWISDEDTVNKLRINCHGDGRAPGTRDEHGKGNGVMTMGDAGLSADELVEALTRHGLKRRSVHTGLLTGLAHAADTWQSEGARWRDDSESHRCQGCKAPFVEGLFTSGKHHCRRCGGLFCGKCSSYKADLAVALTGKNTTAKNVRDARVCGTCYHQVKDYGILARTKGINQKQTATEQKNYGLKTICLACCMGAQADGVSSPERNHNLIGPQLASVPFVQDSLAARLLIALRARNLTGIKVTASNQVLQDRGPEGIAASCGITVPSQKGSGASLRDGLKVCDFVGTGKQTVSFPPYIWGERQSLKAKYDQLAANPLAFAGFTSNTFSGMIKVAGRRLLFGEAEERALTMLHNEFLFFWKFNSWAKIRTGLVTQPGGNPTGYTWALTPPPRVNEVLFVKGKRNATGALGPDSISITVRSDELESFKHYKSYEVS